MMRRIMNRTALALLLSAVVLCSNCSSPGNRAIRQAEPIVWDHPDSALQILDGVIVNSIRGRENLAKFYLLQTAAKDRLYQAIESTDDMLTAYTYYKTRANQDSLTAIATYYMGRAFSYQSTEMALTTFIEAEPLILKLNNDFWTGRVFYQIAWAYYLNGEPKKSIQYYNEALECFIRLKDTMSMAHTYNAIGKTYVYDYENDKAIEVLEKANKVYLESGNMRGIRNNILSMANAYFERDEPETAKKLLWDFYDKYNDGEVILGHRFLLSEIEYMLGNNKAAIEYLETYVELEPNLTANRRSVLEYMLAYYYHDTGDNLSAFEHMDKSIHQLDTANIEKRSATMLEVEKKYEKQELENEYETYRNQSAYIIAICVLAASIITILLIHNIRKRRKRMQDIMNDFRRLSAQLDDFEDMQDKLDGILDKQTEKEFRLREVLTNKILQIQHIAEYLYLYENNPVEFKRKIRVSLLQAKKDEYFAELREIVNDKCHGLIERLRELYPTLTEDDINLCCLSFFGFNNNQISIMFGYTNPNSVFNRRNAIRRKMQLASYASMEGHIAQVISQLKNETKTD